MSKIFTPIKNDNEIYFIAEIGVNHEGSIEKAKHMVKQAANAGAQAAKFQIYKAEKLVTKDAKSYWDTSEESETSQLALFKKYDSFGQKEYYELFDYCNELGIDFLATPFDVDCLEWLDQISTFYKVASADLTNFELLNALAKRKKHIVLSVGASSINEIRTSLEFLFDNGCPSVTILHCVLNYPCSINTSFLYQIERLTANFKKENIFIGYSDHVPSKEVNDDQLIAALTLGCRVFERHFTYDLSLPGNDHYHALNYDGLTSVIQRLNQLLPALASYSEAHILKFQSDAIENARRSIVINKDLQAGAIIKQQDIICKRPGNGISASKFFEVIGRRVNKDLKSDTQLSFDDLEKK